jgi:pimeloyl-ACP methyl ester carboxylesterase
MAGGEFTPAAVLILRKRCDDPRGISSPGTDYRTYMRQFARSHAALLALFVFLAFANGPAFAAAKLQQLAVPAEGHTLTLWAREVRKPKGVIVLLHGRTWSALPDFDLQVPGEQRSVMLSLNAKGYSAFALDMRGYGKTPRDSTGWLTPDRAARDVVATLEWLAGEKKIQRPVLLGWSNGSIVAQLAAQRRPELISDLVLYGYPRDPANPAPAQVVPAEPARAPNTKTAAASDFISPKVTSQKVIDTYVAAALSADPIRVDWRNPEEFAELDPAKIVTPTLVIHGERDPLTPIESQTRLFTRLGTPDRQWVVLAGGDHAALVEDTHAAFVAAIVAFASRPGR